MTTAEATIPFYCTKCATQTCSCWHVRTQTYKDAASITWTESLLSALSTSEATFDVWHLACDAKREQHPLRAHSNAKIKCAKCGQSVIVNPAPKARPVSTAAATVDTKQMSNKKEVVITDGPDVPFVCWEDTPKPCTGHWKIRATKTHNRFEVTCLRCKAEPEIVTPQGGVKSHKCPRCDHGVSVGIRSLPVDSEIKILPKRKECKRCDGTGVFLAAKLVTCLACDGYGGLPCKCIRCTHSDPTACQCKPCVCVGGLRTICLMCEGDCVIFKSPKRTFECPFCISF